jgi:UDP-2,3-diacylglucosamine pyrophosphatase LpxH
VNTRAQPVLDSEHLIVISDLHLGDPIGARDLDGFRADAAFETFVRTKLADLSGGAPRTLVLNGDFVDFPQVPPSSPKRPGIRVGASEGESTQKILRVVDGHEAVFTALRSHLNAGNQLLIVPGNHDVDLYWPNVQSVIRARLGDGVQFVESGMIRSRGIYIEHGHQHSYDNRFDNWPDPRVQYAGVYHLERCWGTFFLEEVYNVLEEEAPWLPLVHPTGVAVKLALKHVGWGSLSASKAAALVCFLARRGGRVAGEHFLAADGNSAIREAEAAVGRALPDGLRDDVAIHLERADYDEDNAGGSTGGEHFLGRTDDAGIGAVAQKEFDRGDVSVAIFGHTHRASISRGNASSGTVVNTGTWTGYIDLDQADGGDDYLELIRAARSPLHRLTYCYVDLASSNALLCEHKEG